MTKVSRCEAGTLLTDLAPHERTTLPLSDAFGPVGYGSHWKVQWAPHRAPC